MAGIGRRNGLQGMDKNCNRRTRAGAFLAACTLLALVSTAASAQFEEGRLERIQALKAPRLDGVVPTYYTPGFKQRARGCVARDAATEMSAHSALNIQSESS